MRILIAPDKFKGSLTAMEVCNALQAGIHDIDSNIEVTKLPLADGGEGTLDLLEESFNLKRMEVRVNDPLMRPISTYYLSDGNTAYIEMAKASGLQLLKAEERNPLLTSTYGTGEIIANALDNELKRIVLLIGGSATSEGGIGMATALGYHFITNGKCEFIPNAAALASIEGMDLSGIHPRVNQVEFTVWSDVKNPLFGKNGAACVYGPQKGASQGVVEQIDNGLRHLAKSLNNGFETQEGAGAAGGLGYGAMTFLNAELKSGIEAILALRDLETHLAHVDLVITGEGKLDGQTLEGKVVSGVANAAKTKHIPLAICCGRKEDAEIAQNNFNAISILDIRSRTQSDQEAMQKAAFYLRQMGQELALKFK
jgi:glycerate kinase